MKEHGFTLIEILIVIVIISIVTTFALLNVNNYLRARHEKTVAEELNALISITQEQAILQPAVLGLYFTPHQYSFYRFTLQPKDRKAKWNLLTRDRVLQTREIPSSVSVKLKIQNKPITFSIKNDEETNPQIIFLSSGDMTSFVLTIGPKNGPSKYTITGAENGVITMKEHK